MEQTLSFKALESALSHIEAVGKSEITFDVSGIPVTLRVLLPEEEIVAKRYAREVLTEKSSQDNQDNQDVLEYVERFKIAVLSYAICAVGDTDLREVQYIDTGETLENGTPIKELKHLAMRRLLLRWTQDARSILFNKYSDLLVTVELQAEKGIVYDPVDLDTEIDRLEKRILALKGEKDRREPASSIKSQVKAISDLDVSNQQDRQQAIDTRISQQVDNSQERQAVFNAGVAPPPERPAPQPEQPQAQAPVQAQPPRPQVPEEYDSFVDAGDTDAMNAAMDAETQRILAMRQNKLPPALSALNLQRQAAVTPPHVQAAKVNEDLQSEELRILTAAREAAAQTPMDSMDGMDVYRQPTEILEKGRPAREQQIRVNGNQNQSKNPRFQSVKPGV